MKRNNINDNIYREVEYNGSRVKILDKNHIRITYNHNHYIVPRATRCIGTTSSFSITFDNELLGYYHNDNEGILWINDNRENNPVIECKMTEDISAMDCCDVVLTIFRESDNMIVMQKNLVKEYDSYYFVKGADYEELPEAGKYVAIVSGIRHQKSRYNYNNNYMVIPFTITNSTVEQLRIKRAECSIQSTYITGSTASLQVKLHHASTSDNDSVVNVQCFDSEMNLIAHNSIAVAAHHCGDSCNFSITPDLFWVENERYTMVINDSQRAIATLSFDMTHKSHCDVCNIEEIEDVYRNTIHLNKHDYRLLQSVSGMSDMRRKIIMQYKQVRYITELNRNFDKLNLSRIRHAIVYKPGEYEKSPILNRAYAVSNILWNEPTEMLNCQALCNDDNLRNLYTGDEVCIWTHLDALYDKRNEALHHIQAFIKDGKHIVLYDSPKSIERFFSIYPDLRDLFDTEYTFRGTNATVKEIAYRFVREIRANNKILISEDAIRYIYETLTHKIARNECIDNYDHSSIENFIWNSVVNKVERRILSMPQEHVTMMGEQVKRLHIEDIDFGYFTATQPVQENTQSCLGELDKMIGLNNIKEEIITLATQLQFNQRRMQMGLPSGTTGCHHMIFTGNPGTGKTTVAKMIGKIFHSLGLLSNGEVIVTERATLLGKYIGDTEDNMRNILQNAKGKVLFIDEAYTLCRSSDDNRDYGRHAIESLLTTLADDNADILVIMAGYKNEMDTMLSINTGLRGRFPHQWHFEDYSSNELMQIAYNMLQEQQYTLAPEADKLLRDIIDEKLQACDQEFSNARWIKQYITHRVLPAMAARVMKLANSNDKSVYTTIEACDIATTHTPVAAVEKKTRNRIGFCTLQHSDAA